MTGLPNKIVGLVGMSGAGKSTVCRMFAENGYTIIDCDMIAREVAEPHSAFLKELSGLYAELIRPDGSLDRQRTAELIFNDDTARMRYNRMIYPYITYSVIDRIKRSDSDVLIDAPTLFEAGLEVICDNIVSVCADRDICAERIIKRDGISPQLASARLSSQHDIGYYKERSDHCIVNNGTEDELFAAAAAVIASLKGE